MQITPNGFKEAITRAEKDDRGLGWINQKVNCPLKYKDATPDKLDNSIKKFLTDLKDENLSYFLHGNVGTGKTYASYAIAKLYYVNKIPVIMYNFIDLLTQIKESFNKDGKDDYIRNIVTSKEMIILDDMGAEKTSDWVVEILYRLIDYRYVNMIPIAIISNHGIPELADRYGDRIMSRIVEMVGKNIIKFIGKDRRLG